ncbi:hypothetical protein HK099_004538 [Clydaea vesicula]|uniref:rRNA-processing protein EFG1 n=1 Tax=Clydaea vesicula TaxID=447962 RepID=A0AAD5U331_9FUNG|nr:hypothetical protein HK099_004538 [Clydaea vesicula]KAJ3379653.1 hypothetical protein HDU92_006538 [Lobulomyces angularis]
MPKSSKVRREKQLPVHELTASQLKKKERDTRRILAKQQKSERGNAAKKVELERRLEAITVQKETKKLQNTSKKLSEKYKYVKFVEQTKVERKIKQLEKKIKNKAEDNLQKNNNSSNEKEYEILKEYQKAILHLNYIKFFPSDLKYISILKLDNLTAKAKLLQDKIIEKVSFFMENKKTLHVFKKSDFIGVNKNDAATELEQEPVEAVEDDFFA